MSAWRIIVRSYAEADITDAAIWYQGQRAGLGAEFVAEVDVASARSKTTREPFPG